MIRLEGSTCRRWIVCSNLTQDQKTEQEATEQSAENFPRCTHGRSIGGVHSIDAVCEPFESNNGRSNYRLSMLFVVIQLIYQIMPNLVIVRTLYETRER